MTTPVGRPPMHPSQDMGGHPLADPLGFPLAFKQWVVEYVTQELQLPKVFGFTPASVSVTGIIPATGTAATAGTGFTYTHTNTSGVYVVTFATAFASTPVVVVSSQQSSRAPIITALSATGFTVSVQTYASAASDGAFTFVAFTTV